MVSARSDSAMFDCEVEVMGLWDGGLTIPAIASRLGKDVTYVRRIITRYSIQPYDHVEKLARDGTLRLLAAIQRHHPEMVNGGAQ